MLDYKKLCNILIAGLSQICDITIQAKSQSSQEIFDAAKKAIEVCDDIIIEYDSIPEDEFEKLDDVDKGQREVLYALARAVRNAYEQKSNAVEIGDEIYGLVDL